MSTGSQKPRWLICLFFAAVLFALGQGPGENAAGHKPPASPPPSAAEIAHGRKLFDERCAVCHFSASPAKKIGPGLKDLSKRGTYADGKAVNDASLRAWIEKGGKDMPGFKDALTAEQVRALVAYLKTL